jgi:small subunit ribosomal protein S20
MANTKSALKRSRQTITRTARNRRILSGLKTQVRKTRSVLESKDKAKALIAVAELSSALDKAAKHGIIHQNSADRRKSVYNKALVALG